MDSFPSQISKYRILEEVGRGGMAVVYRGLDQTLDREVAVKILHAHLATDPESRARFQREARAVARLHHPHIIEIFDFADSGDGPSYIVTEFIKGQTLRVFIEQHRAYFPEVAVMIAIELCEAVGHAHGLQIIHRDLKPENVMVDQSGLLKLMDFGIAKVIDQQQQMTLTGSILGSPAHMAPELLEGKELDFRSDVFSIGTVLYWLATGQLPFSGKNPHQVLKCILQGTYPDPQQVNPAVGSELARIIRRALAHDPEDRYPSAASMQAALHETLAELELGDIDSELKFFFANPESYIESLKQKVSRYLLERGKRLLKEAKYREALETLDRLLALEPGQTEALALVNGIHRRRQWRRRIAMGLGTVAAVLLFAGAGWLVVTHWPQPAVLPDAGTLIVPPPLRADAGTPGADPAVASTGLPADAGLPAPADPTPTPSDRKVTAGDGWGHVGPDHAVAVATVKQPIKIISEPFFERVLIDGREVAVADRATQYGQVFTGELPVGRHRAVLQHSGCQDDEFEILVSAQLKSPSDLEFRRVLRFRPATLVIESELPQAAVWVDNVFKGNAGETAQNPITITMEGKQGQREVKVRLALPNGAGLERGVKVSAGTRSVLAARQADFVKGTDGGSR